MKKITATIIGIVASALTLSAAEPAIGTWKKKATDPSAAKSATELMLVIERTAANGRHLTWKTRGPDGNETVLMTLDSALDGSDAPVLAPDGKPSGQTMGIKRIDERHATTTLKMRGKQYATSASEISADGKTMTIVTETSPSVPGTAGGPSTTTEIWEKQ